MTKQVQAIRAEIERLYDGEAPAHAQQCDFDDGYFTGIAAISKFLDSLPEEKSNKDLEDEIATWLSEHLRFENKDYEYLKEPLTEWAGCIARHFYELGQASVPMPEDTVLFQKGVAEGKRLMMEDAVEATIENGIYLSSIDCTKMGYKLGDKVKVIIVEEEQK